MAKSTEALFVLPYNQLVRIKAASNTHMTSDAGALLMRSVIARTGLIEFLTERLYDPRNQHRIRYSLAHLLLQWLLQLIQGWHALWTAQLRTDAAFGMSTSIERGAVEAGRTLASQSTMSHLLRLLGKADNPSHLEAAVQKLAIEHMLVRNGGRRRDEVVIDVDAVPVDAHGKQLGSAYHGHYKRTVFLPLIASCGESGDVLGAQLRPGNRREVTDCEDFMVSMADGVRQHAAERVIIRLDAGFNSGVVFTRLEAEGLHYVMRLRKNKVLEALAAPYVEDCSYERKTYVELEYGAQSWEKTRRVILVVKPRPGELFNDCHFLVTNLDADTHSGEVLAALYSRRGKAEMHQGEIKAICTLSFSSSPRAKSHYRNVPIAREDIAEADEDAEVQAENAVRLQVYMLVYQLLHISRCLLHSPPPPVGSEPDEMALLAEGLHDTGSQSSGTEAALDESTDAFSETAMEADGSAVADTDSSSSERPHIHLRTFRLQVLKVGATLARHARYVTFYIALSAVQAWKRFWERLRQLHWQSVPDL